MLETIKNAWKVKEIRNKIIYTIFIILIFRIGSAIPVPFIDYGELSELAKKAYDINAESGNQFFSYLSILTGGGLEYGAIFAILYPLVIWSRVILKKHTLTQAIAGGVQGFFLTVIEMHLFMNILNLPVSNITGFETTILYIISIIITPIILGILSYVKTKNPQKIFIITQIILLLAFLTLTPVNITLIYIIISISSIIISLIAGDEFIWCKILKNQSFKTL